MTLDDTNDNVFRADWFFLADYFDRIIRCVTMRCRINLGSRVCYTIVIIIVFPIMLEIFLTAELV
jgi:hypothetical protein